jgi:peroxiredoxin
MNRNAGCGTHRGSSLRGLSALLLVLWATAGIAEAALRIGDVPPPISLSGINEVPVKIPESLNGKVTVLHFWRIGCTSCALEMPAMNDLYGRYQKKGLEILAVNVGQERKTVKAFVAELGLSYPILIDSDGKNAALYGVTDLPRTYLIDRKGVVRYRIVGSATAETLRRLILSLL